MLGYCSKGTRNPVKILQRIDVILECLNRRLIIIFEDIDRNTNDATLYNEIASFLNAAKRLNRISFIIAVGPDERASAMLAKLCEHNEYLQKIHKNQLIGIFEKLISYLYDESYPDDELFQEYDAVVNFLGIPRNSMEEKISDYSGRENPIDYIVQLLDKPRHLKIYVRIIRRKWDRLHGEIDFKTLLLLSVIEAATPEAYIFIYNNIRALRNITQALSSGNQADDDNKRTALLKKWEEATQDVFWDKQAAYRIICTLFPALRTQQEDRVISYLLNEGTLQGLVDNSVSNYYKRFNQERIPPGDIKDQPIIRAIKKWKEDHYATSYMCDDGTRLKLSDAIFEIEGMDDKVEQFAFCCRIFAFRLSHYSCRTTKVAVKRQPI